MSVSNNFYNLIDNLEGILLVVSAKYFESTGLSFYDLSPTEQRKLLEENEQYAQAVFGKHDPTV